MDQFECQSGDLITPSKSHPRVHTLFYRLRHNLTEHGFFATLRKAKSKLTSGEEISGLQVLSLQVNAASATEVLGLQPGELIEVRSEEEIRSILDATGKTRGLGFMPEMWEYCGQRLRVFKRVEKICLENAPRAVRKVESTVLLEGAVCKGGGIGCDRACFYFWRECWLKRVPQGQGDAIQVRMIQIKMK